MNIPPHRPRARSPRVVARPGSPPDPDVPVKGIRLVVLLRYAAQQAVNHSARGRLYRFSHRRSLAHVIGYRAPSRNAGQGVPLRATRASKQNPANYETAGARIDLAQHSRRGRKPQETRCTLNFGTHREGPPRRCRPHPRQTRHHP